MKQCCEEWLKSQFGDDRETIEAIYAEYVTTMTGLASDLDAARGSGDAQALDRVLHTIKGTAGMAGDGELSELANRARTPEGAGLIDEVARRMTKF